MFALGIVMMFVFYNGTVKCIGFALALLGLILTKIKFEVRR